VTAGPPPYGVWLVSGQRAVRRAVADDGRPALEVECVHGHRSLVRAPAEWGRDAQLARLRDIEVEATRRPCGWTLCDGTKIKRQPPRRRRR
jgi:hypothetical protein